MTIFGIIISLYNINISWIGIYLLSALFGLIIASIIIIFSDLDIYNKLYKYLLIFGLIIFSLFIVYNTNIILNANYKQDAIHASLDFYLSFINIFIRLFK
jgi:FtsH-binding integral membrane protein